MNRYFLIFFSVLMLWTSGCGLNKEISFAGRTMGTTYSVKIVSGYFDGSEKIQQQVEQRLEEINRSMSIYMKESEISQFNQHRTKKPFPVSADFMRVMTMGRQIHRHSGGAWDATVNPLVNLWGFGNKKQLRQIPSPEDIERTKTVIGFEKILTEQASNLLQKKEPAVALDFGSIAKGYGVDQIAGVLEKNGYRNYLVEIGGEVYAAGLRLDGENWRVGVNTPRKTAAYTDVYKVVTLRDKAMATSGDYRNFFEMNGKIYSHVIDPRTGYPVSNGVVSVSIIAESCAFADGLATAIMVMGHVAGMALVENLENVEGLIVVQDAEGQLRDYFSAGFQPRPE